MNIAITGGTGFVGTALTMSFLKNGHNVYILTRHQKPSNENGLHYVQWLSEGSQPEAELENMDVFINLAGESINSGRWTEARKEQIYNSRIHSTREVIRILSVVKKKPSVLISASAIGFYGISRKETFTEKNTKHGHDFLAETVRSWEEEAKVAQTLGIRTVFSRFGIILGDKEGALPKIVRPYRFFAGGTVGSGAQWVSWVHIDDVVGMIHFAIENSVIEGPINVVAPHPAMMKDFGKSIAKVIHRPHWLPAPSPAIKLLLGEMSILVLEGQKVLPEKAEKNGYQFAHSSLDEALTSILQY
ncbi:TIGR01777 family oxidoreductase [Bacillus sp. DJP31]|uniref:TIGR01777 family oxidoreductase n=1 Tax=Bacillus sp. DJP31 TaxID=3409789 RepID=UPI003BB71765